MRTAFFGVSPFDFELITLDCWYTL